MGVDAAYHGMEIQILDHDAPIYKNLRVYQQHGSVYGIIPAKRIKFGELGTWNVEEIRAVGDRITVTVNGEVILDGDIREACQGHNVSEDGSKKNPYTVDHRNHPGLFNKKGHIGLRTRRRHPVPQHPHQVSRREDTEREIDDLGGTRSRDEQPTGRRHRVSGRYRNDRSRPAKAAHPKTGCRTQETAANTNSDP